MDTSQSSRESLDALEKTIEYATEKSAAEIRNASISELRREMETKTRKPLRFTSRFPFIGRGNVLRDRLLTSKQINESLDRILR